MTVAIKSDDWQQDISDSQSWLLTSLQQESHWWWTISICWKSLKISNNKNRAISHHTKILRSTHNSRLHWKSPTQCHAVIVSLPSSCCLLWQPIIASKSVMVLPKSDEMGDKRISEPVIMTSKFNNNVASNSFIENINIMKIPVLLVHYGEIVYYFCPVQESKSVT